MARSGAVLCNWPAHPAAATQPNPVPGDPPQGVPQPGTGARWSTAGRAALCSGCLSALQARLLLDRGVCRAQRPDEGVLGERGDELTLLGVHRAADVGHAGTHLGALVAVEQPVVPS